LTYKSFQQIIKQSPATVQAIIDETGLTENEINQSPEKAYKEYLLQLRANKVIDNAQYTDLLEDAGILIVK